MNAEDRRGGGKSRKSRDSTRRLAIDQKKKGKRKEKKALGVGKGGNYTGGTEHKYGGGPAGRAVIVLTLPNRAGSGARPTSINIHKKRKKGRRSRKAR